MSERLLSAKRLVDKVGLCKSTIYRMERKGEFPTRRKVSEHRVGWVESEVDEWIAERAKCA